MAETGFTLPTAVKMYDSNALIEKLARRGACPSALDWIRRHNHTEVSAWQECVVNTWMLWALDLKHPRRRTNDDRDQLIRLLLRVAFEACNYTTKSFAGYLAGLLGSLEPRYLGLLPFKKDKLTELEFQYTSRDRARRLAGDTYDNLLYPYLVLRNTLMAYADPGYEYAATTLYLLNMASISYGAPLSGSQLCDLIRAIYPEPPHG